MPFRSRNSLKDTVEYAVRELKNPARRRTVLSVSAILVLTIGWYVYWTLSSPLSIDAPLPAVLADCPDSIAPLPASVVEAAIRDELSSAMDWLVRAMARDYGEI